ncbi:hypothetical protein PHMEG_0002038 [Phytophthora megakarya]|uniref:Uncharacterized protein n=1 Tax=Phytophthora megakarya TaxID=4795 RepID=A0A225WZL1_9STRA|nr:hypothetical protein PHMEG_0002038 [Phytophthora megakarya]
MAQGRPDEYGLKRSSGVDYSQVRDRQIDDDRFARQRSIRAATAAVRSLLEQPNVGAKAAAPQSATMDAFMRMVTGKEERTIADRISDPNRPTWEQYKKENADKLDLNGNGEKEMKEYRKKLDAAREKKLAGSTSKKRKKKHKKRSRSSSDDSSEDERRSKHKSRKKKKSHKRRRKSSDTDESASDSNDDRSRRHKRSKKSKKSSRKDRDASPSPFNRKCRICRSCELAMGDTESRRRFMQLLRQGVQHKVQQQQTKTVASDSGDEVRRPSLPDCNIESVGAWQTLAWRDAFSMAPYFQETVDGRPLRIKQVLQGELNGFGTGLTVWPAACVLLKHLEHRAARNPKALVDSDDPFILELGSGTGAVGIAAAMLLRAGRVVLTDMDNVRFIMQENADLAQQDGAVDSHVVVDVEGYEWGHSPSEKLLPSPDLILVSDCILPRLYPIEPLVEALARLSGPHTRILISYEHRHYQHFQPKDRFWELMQTRGFSLRVIDTDEYHPLYVAEDIEVWEITPA